ncbi:uncharacterized protein BO97DRAFT_60440 [Aspergillus homomorphus CBS 101889]|uniref:Uncharacterized protein n=1 Tax=Aspergillus homomorphus (strain CBS 101889) TaxID=1450537 RepID=A0A395HWF1_ASPHC|nr:hypothetical protein BO97DRAFT_60440 [Aspergillus homomorphus CBS 101889]RAL12140.1 hypothetical protein BO97DRAFT_60440 [Aspergillus homomorphus CBS 101889]
MHVDEVLELKVRKEKGINITTRQPSPPLLRLLQLLQPPQGSFRLLHSPPPDPSSPVTNNVPRYHLFPPTPLLLLLLLLALRITPVNLIYPP